MISLRTLRALTCAFATFACTRIAIAQDRGAAVYAPPTGTLVAPSDQAPYYALAESAGATFGLTLQPDPAMAAVALAVANEILRDPTAGDLSYASARSVINSAGVADHDVRYQYWVLHPGAALPDIAGDVSASMSGTRNLAYDRVGVARAANLAVSIVVIAYGWHTATLDTPVPRFAVTGARVHYAAHIRPDFHDPWIDITRPEGRVERHMLAAGPVVAFDHAFDTRGVWQMELSATGVIGPRPLLNFFTYVDIAPPPLPPRAAMNASPEDPARAEAALLAMINDARRTAGIAPVRLAPALSDVARAHSTDMVEHHFEGHVSPTTGTPDDRARRAGIRSQMVLENLVAGANATAIHETFMASPGHRAAILDERITDVGIGVVSTRTALTATEDFIVVTPRHDVVHDTALLLDRINSARSSRGLAALASPAPASRYATDTAQSFFGPDAPSIRALEQRARDGVRQVGVPFRSATVQVVAMVGLDEVARADWLFTPSIQAIGIGLAQGNRADQPPNQVIAVLVGIENTIALTDTTAATNALTVHVQAARTAAGLAPLVVDARVARYAQSLASSFFAGSESPNALQARALAGFAQTGVRARMLIALATPTSSVDDLPLPASLARADLTVGGCAVAQGTRADTLRNQPFVVIILVAVP